jgi:hypothetical protein
MPDDGLAGGSLILKPAMSRWRGWTLYRHLSPFGSRNCLGQNVDCVANLGFLGRGEHRADFFEPALPGSHAGFYRGTSFAGQAYQSGAPVADYFTPLNHALLDHPFHHLTHRRLGGKHGVHQPRHITGAMIVQAHEYIHLGHRQPGVVGEGVKILKGTFGEVGQPIEHFGIEIV